MRIVVCCLLVAAFASLSNAASRPNFVLIYTDDHGYADLSSQGVLSDIKTPQIDAMDAAGVRMSSGYSSAPQCVPSRAGLLTGKYQNRFGVESNGVDLSGFDAEQTIAERLKKVGYATGMTGKWHLGSANEITSHGFADVFYQGGAWTNFDFSGKTVPPGTRNREKYHIDACSDSACAFVKRHANESFFLYVAYRAPHVPLDATEKYLKRFPGEMPQRRRQALAMLSAVDDGVGNILATLRELELEESTLVFFIGDNGAPLKIHRLDAPGGGPGWDGSLNTPMNGEKGMLSEGGMRVPFVVQWKGKIQPGKVYDEPVIALDAAATICELAGCTETDSLDGKNLLPYLSGQKSGLPHAELYWRWTSQAAIRAGKWKLLRGAGREYLFDLENDVEEKHSVLSQNRDIADSLRERLRNWSGELEPPGLQTRAPGVAEKGYFDFYLDGLPAPPPREKFIPQGKSKRKDARIQGWVARGALSTQSENALLIAPTEKPKTKPFIATANLKLEGKFVVAVRSKHSEDGQIKIAWRTSKQKDFDAKQFVAIDCRRSDEFKTHEIKVNNQATAVHVRVILPGGKSQIERIEITQAKSAPVNQWVFRKN